MERFLYKYLDTSPLLHPHHSLEVDALSIDTITHFVRLTPTDLNLYDCIL